MPFAVKTVNKIILCLLLLFVTTLSISNRVEAEAQFPLYPVIAPNVQFWEKVYGTYSSNQGVLHDKINLGIIYTAVDLVAWGTPGASKINSSLIKLARARYKNILTTLAGGKKPATREEKRIAALFKRNGSPSYRRARDNIRLQIGQKDRFKAGVIRSGAYIPGIKRILRAHGLPLELAYLPHVESSFNLRAHSKSAAVGLWQFTKHTGRDYMTINDLVDERYDVYLSSHAAAKFLKENYRQLGSWPLALTAYNYGRAGMVRAQRQWGGYPNIYRNHRTRLFKFASKNFYSEFLAAVRIARQLENDPALIKDRPWASATVRLKKYAAVQDLCTYFGVSRKDFSRLNPALRDPVIEGRKYIPKGVLVRLPATKRIRQRIKTMPNRLFHNSQVQDRVYRVKKGDTAASIARKYRISLKQLSQANHLNKKATIRIGQKLKIPAKGSYRSGKTSSKIIILKQTAKRKP